MNCDLYSFEVYLVVVVVFFNFEKDVRREVPDLLELKDLEVAEMRKDLMLPLECKKSKKRKNKKKKKNKDRYFFLNFFLSFCLLIMFFWGGMYHSPRAQRRRTRGKRSDKKMQKQKE